MQTLVNRTARELAREYFNGRLSFNDYRDNRRRLVDQVTGLDADLEDAAEPEATLPPVVEETIPTSRVSDSAVAQETVPETKGVPLPVILLLVIGGLGAAGWLLFSGEDDAPQESLAGSTQAPVPAVQESLEADQAVQLVSDFVQADNWSNDALAGFVLAWSTLEAGDQERAREASGFRLLVDGLREQILEQRALGDMARADGRETVLMSFAEHLGALPLLTDSEPVTKPDETIAEVQEVVPPVVDEPAPEIVQQAEPPVAPQPVPKVEAQPESRDEKAPSPEAVTPEEVTPKIAKRVVKPVVVPAPVAMQAKSSPTVSAPAQVALSSPDKDPCPASLVGTRRPVCRDTLTDGEPGPVLVVLPAGGFQMGSSREDNEQPVHRVDINRPFAISAYEVSHADYQRFCRAGKTNCPAGHWSGEYDPMTNVSWNDANAYTQWLSQASGAVYRLPSEAEWEYAARAGTTTEYPFSDGDKILPSDARFDADAPLPVNDKSVNANRFRLRHIVGNVREWVADVWSENYRNAPADGGVRTQPDTGKRAVRGGSYADDAGKLRSAARSGLSVDTRDRRTGFRVVREIRK